MALADFSVGHRERVFVRSQSAFGTQADPQSSSYVRIEGSMGARRTKQRQFEGDKRDNASPVNAFDLLSAVEWSMPEGNLRPSGALGATPEMDPFLLGLLGARNTANLTTTVSVSPTPTTTGCTLASVTGLQVGDLIKFASGDVRQVATLVSSAITWFPALAVAPSTGTAVTSGTTYKPLADPDATITLLRHMVHTSDVFPDCWVNEGTIRFAKDSWLRASFAGAGAGKRARIGSSTLSAAVTTAGQTAFTVAVGDGVLFDVADAFGYAMIGTEVVRVTARAGDVLTVARAQLGTTAAASYAIGAELTPYMPAATLTGTAVTGIAGYFVIWDGTTSQTVSFDSAEISVQNGFAARTEYGANGYAIGYMRSEPTRSVQLNATLRYKRAANLIRDAADRGRQIACVLTCGNSAVNGSLFAAVLPRVIFDAEPLPESPANGDALITITGTAYASSVTAEDAISIGNL